MRIKTLFTGFCCGIILAPAMALAADTAHAALDWQTVADTPFVIVAPSEGNRGHLPAVRCGTRRGGERGRRRNGTFYHPRTSRVKLPPSR